MESWLAAGEGWRRLASQGFPQVCLARVKCGWRGGAGSMVVIGLHSWCGLRVAGERVSSSDAKWLDGGTRTRESL